MIDRDVKRGRDELYHNFPTLAKMIASVSTVQLDRFVLQKQLLDLINNKI